MIKKSFKLENNYLLDDKYKVLFSIKKGQYAETYRVKTNDNQVKFLKLFSYSKLHKTQFDSEGKVLEIEILKQLNHPNIVKFIDFGNLIIDKQKYSYLVLEYISGETIAEMIKRETVINHYEAKDIIKGVLNGLEYLHNLSTPIIHNDISSLNIMLDLSKNIPTVKIIDFGYSRYLNQSHNEFNKDGLDPYFSANEIFNKIFSVQSDVFSVGALYYKLLFGIPPWYNELSRFKKDKTNLEEQVLIERKKPLKFLNSNYKIKENIIDVIVKALDSNVDNRFKNIEEFLKAINEDLKIEISSNKKKGKLNKPSNKTKKGNGFSSIAGMQELKEIVKSEIIDALSDVESYKEYGLSIPNGMLLWGPPGCGKTYFAEKMAEEIGFSFFHIKPADIQSKWVNASQENIKNLFEEARKNAPSLIFIDELDALVPNRNDSNVHHMNSSAVNEFLAQMNNLGDDGVFFIGATNWPNTIDPAILRPGRIDNKVYVSVPDQENRVSLFKYYLSKRPAELGLDYSDLAKKTENYSAVDIKYICDKSARAAHKKKCRISNEMVINSIKDTPPTSSQEELEKYREIKSKMDGKLIKTERKKIGF